MKGIILAGGSGTRLYPLTKVVCKQLLPVYDKPMICYPLSTLMLLGITDILIISTPSDTPLIEHYLGDGSELGIKLSYKVQDEPRGIAEAFLLGKDFIADQPACLILGDNIFYLGDQLSAIRQRIAAPDGAIIFGYHVRDPERFGVIELEKDSDMVKSIEEKPDNPKSHYAAVGLYCYSSDVTEKVEKLESSARRELEITCLNNLYLEEQRLQAIQLKRGAAWLDAGTPESLLEASKYMGAIEDRQGLKLSCMEEVAYRMGYINRTDFEDIIDGLPEQLAYTNYLKQVLNE